MKKHALISFSLVALLVAFGAFYAFKPNTSDANSPVHSIPVSLVMSIEAYQPPLSDSPEPLDSTESAEPKADIPNEKSAPAEESAGATREEEAQPDKIEAKSAPVEVTTDAAGDGEPQSDKNAADADSAPSEEGTGTPNEPNEEEVQPPSVGEAEDSLDDDGEPQTDNYVVQEEDPQEGQEASTNSEKHKVRVVDEGKGVYAVGETVTMSSRLTGFSGNLKYQWQVDKGSGWQDIPGANEAKYSFVFSEENSGYSWRVAVTEEN